MTYYDRKSTEPDPFYADDRPDDSPDRELAAYARGPGYYRDARAFVDLCESLSGRPCTGGGCDLGAPCSRHARITEVVARYQRMLARRT